MPTKRLPISWMYFAKKKLFLIHIISIRVRHPQMFRLFQGILDGPGVEIVECAFQLWRDHLGFMMVLLLVLDHRALHDMWGFKYKSR